MGQARQRAGELGNVSAHANQATSMGWFIARWRLEISYLTLNEKRGAGADKLPLAPRFSAAL